MKTIVEINSVANSGSTGRIAEEIGRLAINHGYDCYMAYGRRDNGSKLNTIRIGTEGDIILHGMESRLLDNHGFASRAATRRFIKQLEEINPDIIHLHNIHGYYLNVRCLFDYLQEAHVPVVWTLHDCWPITGHCSHFEIIGCEKWKSECCHCPQISRYPKSFIDRSQRNFELKKQLFTSIIGHTTIVTPSIWLRNIVNQSFLKDAINHVINNGVDTDIFKPSAETRYLKNLNIDTQKHIILGVASVWTKSKGLYDFIGLSRTLDSSFQTVLVGLNDRQLKDLPKNMIGIKRTESAQELAALYSVADVFVNPTYSDNFPTTNIEALACGTPVITYDTGGSPEAVDSLTGRVVEKGNMDMLVSSIKEMLSVDRETLRKNCRSRAERLYDKNDRFMDYIRLYDSILENNKQL